MIASSSTDFTRAATPCGGVLPRPAPQHSWLAKFVGTWQTDIEFTAQPDQPPLRSQGRETARLLGAFWLITEGTNDTFPYASRLTLGYDIARDRFVGSWIDSLSGHFWLYEGHLDATGEQLTLNTTGPSPSAPGGIGRFRETIEFITPDRRRFTSAQEGLDGQWTTWLTSHHRRLP